MSDPTLELTKQFIAAQSLTPHDAGCQDVIIARLEALGFSIECLEFNDKHGTVKNLWARKGTQSPCFCFAGHTDVVPVGNIDKWESDPFLPTERDGQLFGRGAADMKTSLAAFITSIESFIEQHPDHKGSIALLITSDEEGPATCGTIKVIETLEARDEKIDYCLVGEPSSSAQLGDVIKNGRRGSFGGVITVTGIQGHVAYPHLADNPIHHSGKVISELTEIEWDQGSDYFPASTLQISNIKGGTGATNVIPETVAITFNIRFSTELTPQLIQQRIEAQLDKLDVNYSIEWTLYGLPFLTERGTLVDACVDAIRSQVQIETELSTSGGTSDGRFIAPTGAQVVELGPINATIHKVNECVDLKAPAQLSKIYATVLKNLLT